MAHILPDSPPQSLPLEVLRVFKALKLLPDSYYIWHHLAPWQLDAPDFLILSQDRRAVLIKVSSSAASQTSQAAQLLLLDDHRVPLGEPEKNVLDTFIKNIDFDGKFSLETLIIFPNIQTRLVEESRLVRKPGDPLWVGREILQPESANHWDKFFPDEAIDQVLLEKIRHRFTPEIVVPADLTVRQPIERRIQAGLVDYLLDYNQEAAVKHDLDLGPEGVNLEKDFRLNIINGVAGSGKTLILLYRLRLLYHFYPEKKFLVLTHNRPLNFDLQSRFNRLEGDLPKNIEWRTFNAWCREYWPEKPAWKNPISLLKRKRVIREVWEKNLQETSISERMLISEIDWLKDQHPMSESDYLNLDRRGRGFGLNVDQRKKIWQSIISYQQILAQSNEIDWGDIPRRLWQFIKDGTISLPTYDFIFIDEAQFFAPIWVTLIQKALNPQNSHLFLVADPTQGFLGRKTTWKSIGLNARGRSHQLRRSYRTTLEILKFATLFYRLRLPNENDEDILKPDLINMYSTGTIPQIISLDSSQDEITRVANEVAEFVKKGYPKKDLLLLHANGQGVNALIEAINTRIDKNAAFDPKDTYPGNYVRVTTINAGAGLESPIVFLVGLRELFEEEQSLRLSDDEREDLIQENTRKIYMACTRAGQRLVFTYVGDLPDVLKNIINQN